MREWDENSDEGYHHKSQLGGAEKMAAATKEVESTPRWT